MDCMGKSVVGASWRDCGRCVDGSGADGHTEFCCEGAEVAGNGGGTWGSVIVDDGV